ncbi:OTU domain-containing protein 4 isoform X2 [Cryptotermes secundus]|uniref:OTU domain-containing protein 4 isoform X2 n=1 Tax=Cryptotermes secundus TaxID=105785 RepID=UPI001454BD0A|nr:OTU domain-containing protein 4 isoform X2 [Cryptotermes secundus]
MLSPRERFITMVPRRSYPKPIGPMDQWLESQGYYRKHTARDGSCLFRAVSEQVFYVQAVHQNVRRQCVEFIQKNKLKFQEFLKEPLEDYVVRMLDSREWGGQMEINAMALLYHHDVLVFEEVGRSPAVATNYGFTKKILLCLSSDNHYDSVYPKLFIMKAAFCQSLVYEVLYKNVFQLPDVNYAVNKMLHDKTNRVQKERVMNEDRFISCGSFGFSMEISLESNKDYKDHEDTNVNVKELLAQGATPFPYKVAKALDPNIYRNIEFDIWNDFRKEMKFGWYRNNGELQVGVKCLVKLNPDRSFHAHIQEMSPDRGPVIVFVEELGEKCTVPYDNLEPLPKSEKPQWSLPYKHCHQLSSAQQKSALLALTDFGGKWKKSKVGKPRKMKEGIIHTPLSPRLQYNSKMNAGPIKHSTQHNTRYLHEQIGNQVQLPFQNFSPENFSRLQHYNNVGIDMPGVSMMLEQHNSTSSPTMTQAMMMSLTSPSIAANSIIKSGEHGHSSPERCLSPLQQPDSTTDMSCSQQPVMTDSVDPSLSLSPAQFTSFTAYSNSPPLVSQAPVPTSGPQPGSSSNNPGIMNPSTSFSDTICTKSNTPSYMVCNTGVSGANMGVASMPGGNNHPPRDFSGNFMFQPVNFMAQKSVQIGGSDLPLSDLSTLRFFYNLGHDYFRLSCMYWPNSVQQAKPNFLPAPTMTPNYSENPTFCNPVMTSNNITNEHHMPDSAPSLQEDLYQVGQEVTPNIMLPNDHSVHVSTESDKTGFHASGGGNESVTWQAKQVDMEVSNALQKAFNGDIVSRSNKNPSDGRENRIQNSHVGRPCQNSARHSEPFEAHVTPQQSEDSEVSCGHTIGSPAQSSPPAVLTTSYNIPPPTVPYAFTPMPPTVYNHTMVPFYFPMDSEQGMMLVPYYPQYTVSSPVQLEPQDAVEVSTAVPDVQAVPSHFTGAIYSPVKQSGNTENGCLPPYTIYPQPPTPVLFQQTSVPAGVYPTGPGPEANISVPRWMQTMPGLPHINPTPCMLQSPPTTPVGAPVPYNTVT